MKKIAFVFDDLSEKKGKEILSDFENKGIRFHSSGVIPIQLHADEEFIISSLYKLIQDSDMVIGISTSGNGIAMYINKIIGFKAAPIDSIDDIDDAIDEYKVNAFDISVHNTDVASICINLVGRE